MTIGGKKDQDYDHAAQTNPTLFIHSAIEPDTANTQWLSLTHDQTNGVIDVGTGVINMMDTVTFTGGQTRRLLIPVEDVELDSGSAPTLGQNGTAAQSQFPSLEFDADAGATGDDIVYIEWVAPAGYVADSLRVNVYWSYDTAETDGDDVVFDMAVNAIAAGEVLDAAGTAFTEEDTDIVNADTTVGMLFITQLNPEVEDIVVNDYVNIKFWVDESASDLNASATCDIHYFELEWESTE